MTLEANRVTVEEIAPLRELHRKAMSCQIIHDSFPRRGFSDAYLLRAGGRVAGYGLVANRHWPETVHEFFLLPGYRSQALPLFRRLLEESHAAKVLAQTNDRLQLLMLYDCATDIAAEAVLFEDAVTTHLPCPSGVLRFTTEEDREPLREADLDADAEWMIESEGVPVAAGGVLCHYNPPYGDIYMGVRESHRGRGYGSWLVQELKRIAYERGKTPAARCNPDNVASRRTLQKAGLLPCARLLVGEVVRDSGA
jgi:GNAT superfamily N-acetyltransferase